MNRPRVIVVGAGVAGLAAGHRLQQRGCSVTLLEAESRVGGKTATVSRDGYIVNTGATVLAASYSAMLDIAHDVGADHQFFSPPAVIGVVRNGIVHELRGQGIGALVDFVRTPLLSGRSKLILARMMTGMLRARRKAGYDRPDLRAELDTETVAEYCDRRLNSEIRDHLFDPVLGGIFVVEGKNLSMADLWFTLWKVLLGGLMGYRGGMNTFAEAVANTLDVRTGATVTGVDGVENGVVVRWDTAGDSHVEKVDGVVVATAAPRAIELLPQLNPAMRKIMQDDLEQANFVSIRLGLSKRPATRSLLTVAGTGQLGGVATISYEHNLSEGSAPADKGLIGVLLYHEWATPRLDLSDDEFLAAVLPSLEIVEPGITEKVEFAEVTRWVPGALKSTRGTHTQIAELNKLLDPHDRVQLAGDYLGMPSVNGSVVSGEAAASRLVNALGLG